MAESMFSLLEGKTMFFSYVQPEELVNASVLQESRGNWIQSFPSLSRHTDWELKDKKERDFYINN